MKNRLLLIFILITAMASHSAQCMNPTLKQRALQLANHKSVHLLIGGAVNIAGYCLGGAQGLMVTATATAASVAGPRIYRRYSAPERKEQTPQELLQSLQQTQEELLAQKRAREEARTLGNAHLKKQLSERATYQEKCVQQTQNLMQQTMKADDEAEALLVQIHKLEGELYKLNQQWLQVKINKDKTVTENEAALAQLDARFHEKNRSMTLELEQLKSRIQETQTVEQGKNVAVQQQRLAVIAHISAILKKNPHHLNRSFLEAIAQKPECLESKEICDTLMLIFNSSAEGTGPQKRIVPGVGNKRKFDAVELDMLPEIVPAPDQVQKKQKTVDGQDSTQSTLLDDDAHTQSTTDQAEQQSS